MDMISELLQDVPIDQAIALSCQAFSLVAAIAFYHYLDPKRASTTTRHIVCASVGLLCMVLCYGVEVFHLIAQCVISYVMISYLPVPRRGWIVFATAVAHLMLIHLHNYINHYMEFRPDVTNSMMILAIKVSYTGFSLDDNYKSSSDLTPNQLKRRIREMPSFFEYFSYCFCFLGALFGPAYHYGDYISFIRGDQYKTHWPVSKASKLLIVSLMCILAHFLLADKFSAAFNLSPEMLNSSFMTRHLVLWFTMLLARCKYYFCWISSESICYFCGLGYDPGNNNDTDKSGWGSSIGTVKLLGIEFATSLKMFSDSWNIFTTQFLHFCVYERVKSNKVLYVFLFSATWHGFYPGYYMMFIPLAFSILLGRKLRRTLRPKFQEQAATRFIYDMITWLATTTVIAFNSSAFELKEWSTLYELQKSLYFWPHVVVLLGMLFVPAGKRSGAMRGDKSLQNGNGHSLHSG